MAFAGGMTVPVYKIRLRGHVDAAWFGSLERLQVSYEGSGDTVLTGFVVDQTALFAVLTKVRDLGVPLLSVAEVTDGEDTAT